MESVDINLESQVDNSSKHEKRPNIFQEALEIKFNRFNDPRNCQTLEDVVGKRIEGRVSRARRLDWAPRRIDISRIAEAVRTVQEHNPNHPLEIVDIAGHSGFLDRMLIDEIDRVNGNHSDINVTVVDPDRVVTKAGFKYYQQQGHEPRINFRTETSQQYANRNERADVVLCSWMRPEMDLRPDIEKLDPQLIIFVKDVPGDVGKPSTFENSEKYKKSAAWLGYSGHDIDNFNEYGEYETDNVILIMTREGGIPGQEIRDRLSKVSIQESDKYSWEKQLPPLNVGKIHETDNFDYFRPHLSD